MIQDAELEFLRVEKGLAFQRVQEAQSLCNEAWRQCCQAREATYDQAVANYDVARAVLQRMETEYDEAKCRWWARMEVARAEEDRRIAERAGVGYEYLDNIKVVRKYEDGVVDDHIYFGGKDGIPDEKGHGHYVIEVGETYSYFTREPGSTQGKWWTRRGRHVVRTA